MCLQVVAGVRGWSKCALYVGGRAYRSDYVTWHLAWYSRYQPSALAVRAKASGSVTATAAKRAPVARYCGRRRFWMCTLIKVRNCKTQRAFLFR